MKTTKRFLSIVLMLAMLVSMFTVMAFASAELVEPITPSEGFGQCEHKDALGKTTFVRYEAREANCVQTGYAEHYRCSKCGKFAVLDENGTDFKVIGNLATTPENPKNHAVELNHVEATEDVVEHWYCSACENNYSDAAGQNLLTDLTPEQPDAPSCGDHSAVAVLVAPETDGYNAYAYCSICGKYFELDANGDPDYTKSHDSKAYFKKDDSAKCTLTIKITNARRGKVEAKLGGQWEEVSNNQKIRIAKDGEIEFRATVKSSNYGVYWDYEGFGVTASGRTITVSENSTLDITFVEYSNPSHTHKWVTKFNDTYHWDECSRCGDKTSKVKHTIKSKTDKYGYWYEYCTKCDWTSDYTYNHSSSHKDFDYEDINASYHWKICEDCSYCVKEYHTWIKNTDRKTKSDYPYICKYCDRLSKTAYTDLPFRDVDGNVWYYDDVLYAYINGYMDGLSAGEFAPNQNTTRAQIVTILWRLTGEPRAMKSNKFSDVSSSAYYDKAVSWAVEAGVVNGFDAKTFKPNDYVTREQLAAILYRYAEYMNLSTRGASNLTKYDDYYKIGTWARDAMAWANYHGLINGVSYSRIDPKGNATRAQVAAILHRFAVEFGNY